MGLEIIPTAPSSASSPTVNSTSRAPALYRFPSTSLLFTDTILLFRNFIYLPSIIFPLGTSNPRGELYPWSVGNVFTLAVHVVFIIVGVSGLGLLPLWLRLPGSLWLVAVAAYSVLVWTLAWILNQTPEGELIASQPEMEEVEGEKWLFVNGVMAGRWWVQSAIDELSRQFKRPVHATHNRTFGVVLDLVQCLIQRDLGLSTGCVRNTYKQLRTCLLMLDPKDRTQWRYKKLIVIAHSQGALVLSLAIDMLLADVADEVLQRLEIYTFGCAANHFNNPPNTYGPEDGGEAIRYPTIKHIEHYSNEFDFVCRFGVLAYHPGPRAKQSLSDSDYLEWSLSGRPHVEEDAYHVTGMEDNQFAGKLFMRPGKGGHQFVMHYLDPMFKGGGGGEPVFVPVVASINDAADGQTQAPGVVVDAGKEGLVKKTDLEQTSRLWGYRGGRVPED